MAKEVDMGEAEGPASAASKQSAAPTPAAEPQSPLAALVASVQVIERAVRQKETKAAFNRVLRQTAQIRKRLDAKILAEFVEGTLPEAARAPLLEALGELPAVDETMETEEAGGTKPEAVKGATSGEAEGAKGEGEAAAARPPPSAVPTPVDPAAAAEAVALAQLAVLFALSDARRWAAAGRLADRVALDAGIRPPGAGAGPAPAPPARARPLDALGARLWQAAALAWERDGRGERAVPALLAAHAAAARRRDDAGAESLLNALLRAYVLARRYEAAAALVARAPRGASPRATTAAARHLYYVGVVAAVRLDYPAAAEALALATRRAPVTARGFRAALARWSALVALLRGEVPSRGALVDAGLGAAEAGLAPYAELVRAVRSGDPARFEAAAATGAAAFRRHGTDRVVARLRASVIRAGLARLATAYSRIPFPAVAEHLSLPSARDAADAAAKAIRDGGLDARIERIDAAQPTAGGGASTSTRCLSAPLAPPPLSGSAPGLAFHARVAFCFDVRDDAVRAMRHETLARARIADADVARERAEAELQAAFDEDDL